VRNPLFGHVVWSWRPIATEKARASATIDELHVIDHTFLPFVLHSSDTL
jgi:hypothetical protein